MATADLITQLKQDFDDVYAAGKAADGGSGEDYLQYAKTVQFNSLNDFGKAEVELNLDNITTLLQLCKVTAIENTNNIVEHITINIPKETATTITNASGMLSCVYSCRDTVLKKVTLNFSTKSIQNFNDIFGCLIAVEEIDGIPLDFSSATTMVNPFNYHHSLKEVRFVETSIPLSISFSYSSQLSTDTIQSIIDGLADLTQYYEVGTQIGTNEFEYPTEAKMLEDVVWVSGSDCVMSDGASVYSVTYGEASLIAYAYKKVSDPQTLTLHADVKAKLTDEQKTTITNKGWLLA